MWVDPTAAAPAPMPMRDASPPPPNTGVPGASPSSAAARSVRPPTRSVDWMMGARWSGSTPNIRHSSPLQSSRRVS